jgi:hypothetical protein
MSDFYPAFRKLFFLFLFLFFLAGNQTFATHIVGGGFDMKSLGNYQYRISLTLFFDEINGSSGALDQTVNFSIFRKRDNKLMDNRVVQKELDDQIINYSASSCANVGTTIRTKVLLYILQIELLPGIYNDPFGYYVVWERCCRNDQITNILNPGATGQTFYIEFPPVILNGQPFENDSPLFKPVPNNLFCINQPSFIDFNATDFDGDSLVFELTEPLKSNKAISGDPRVDTSAPRPYFPVDWVSGIGISNQIPGNPALTVNKKTGMLSVRPNTLGLFVFSVICHEYRNGKKIGEVRREFQQLVVDCPPNNPPVITIPDPIGPRRLGENDTIFISNNTQTRTCVNVKATDFDANQTVKLRAIPLNFTPISPITGDTLKLITSSQDTARLSFCLPACVGSSKSNPFHLRVLVLDNGCAGSLADTLNIFVVLNVPPILVPTISLTPPDSAFSIPSEDSLKILVKSVVPSNQSNQLRGELFNNRNIQQNFALLNMSFPSKNGSGPQSSIYQWKAPCSVPTGQPYRIDFKVNTVFCNQNIELKKSVNVSVVPDLPKPRIMAAGKDSSLNEIEISGENQKTISQSILGKINGKKDVTLYTTASPMEMLNYGLTFPGKTGKTLVSQNLTWTPDCEKTNLTFPKTFSLVAQSNTCGQNRYDSLRVKLLLPVPGLKDFNPINLITNNEDGKNDVFSLKALGLETGCGFSFEGIEIFDRWGEKDFESLDPAFEWPRAIAKKGTYFYFIKVNGKKYNSWIQVVK